MCQPPLLCISFHAPVHLSFPLSLSLSLAFSPSGRLHSVDQYLNIKLADVRQPDPASASAASAASTAPLPSPALASVRNAFIRGSVVRYVLLPAAGVDTELLHDATRREARGPG